eukprot:15729-Heterococcus_DN1.PRE.1
MTPGSGRKRPRASMTPATCSGYTTSNISSAANSQSAKPAVKSKIATVSRFVSKQTTLVVSSVDSLVQADYAQLIAEDLADDAQQRNSNGSDSDDVVVGGLQQHSSSVYCNCTEAQQKLIRKTLKEAGPFQGMFPPLWNTAQLKHADEPPNTEKEVHKWMSGVRKVPISRHCAHAAKPCTQHTCCAKALDSTHMQQRTQQQHSVSYIHQTAFCSSSSEEFWAIEDLLREGLPNAKLTKVERVQARSMWRRYSELCVMSYSSCSTVVVQPVSTAHAG